MTKIAYQVSLAIPNGPQVSLLGEVEGDTYSKSEIEVPAITGTTAGTITLNIQAGAPSNIVLLLISTDKGSYSDDDKKLKFKIKKDATDTTATEILLKAPFLVLGAAATSLLDASSVAIIEFTNESKNPARIEILVGRDAVSKS